MSERVDLNAAFPGRAVTVGPDGHGNHGVTCATCGYDNAWTGKWSAWEDADSHTADICERDWLLSRQPAMVAELRDLRAKVDAVREIALGQFTADYLDSIPDGLVSGEGQLRRNVLAALGDVAGRGEGA